MYIVFEGPEGSGKTSAKRVISDYLINELGFLHLVETREPGGTLIAESIRYIVKNKVEGEVMTPTTEAMLFASSRAQLLETLIVPTLQKGLPAISDRCYISSIAYQGYGRQQDPEHIMQINRLALKELPSPDILFVMTVDYAESQERVCGRDMEVENDRFDNEEESFFNRVNDYYKSIDNTVEGLKDTKIISIDTTYNTPEETKQQVLDAFIEAIGKEKAA